MKNIRIAFAALTIIAGFSAADAQKSPYVADLGRYVAPANKAAEPDSYSYLPDGTALRLAADGRSIVRVDLRSGKDGELLLDQAIRVRPRCRTSRGSPCRPTESRYLCGAIAVPFTGVRSRPGTMSMKCVRAYCVRSVRRMHLHKALCFLPTAGWLRLWQEIIFI